ncbi:MAG: hypothetical protein R3F54_10715 [Alphaproteobacteria bacterium]
MTLQWDHWPLRLMGVLFGLGCLVVGLSGASGGEAGEGHDFAVIAIVTGAIATLGSLISTDIIGFWYCNPKRLAARRAREARSSKLSTGL